jgi:hypothetical protein
MKAKRLNPWHGHTLTKYPISEEAMYSVGLPPSNRSYLSVGSQFVIVKRATSSEFSPTGRGRIPVCRPLGINRPS